jgi:hypothetical protein
MEPKDPVIAVGISELFSDADIQRDFIISRESRVLGTAGGAYDVLKLKDASSVAKTPSYMTYLNSDKVLKSNQGSRSTLIPAINTDIRQGKVTDPTVTSEMMHQVVSILNNMKVGTEANFFGIMRNVNFSKEAKNEVVGGADILHHFLTPLRTLRKDGTHSLLGGSFIITTKESKLSNITRTTISRVKNLGGIVMNIDKKTAPNGVLTAINTKIDKETKNKVSKVWLSDHLKLKALEEKIIQVPHKSIELGVGGVLTDVIVIRTAESADGYELFVKKQFSGFDDTFLKIRVLSDKDLNLDPDKYIYVSAKDYNIYLETIQKDGAAFINPACK